MLQLLILTVVFSVLAFIVLFSLWEILEKADSKGYYILIPIYNIYILILISGLEKRYFYMSFFPLLNLFVYSLTMIYLSDRFSQSINFKFMSVFFPLITIPILAFSKTKYKRSKRSYYEKKKSKKIIGI